jgi:2-amino-4-hydroxy-6-hydroxymethyldihydropteridine diphosphokinase
LYRTAPVGGPDGQPDYLNAVITIAWDRSPFALLALIHQIEADFGRERLVRFGPRTLDIDIVAIDGLTIESASLTVPHPRAHERAFVLVPLAEVSSEYATILGWDGSSRAEVMNVANFDVESSTWVP